VIALRNGDESGIRRKVVRLEAIMATFPMMKIFLTVNAPAVTARPINWWPMPHHDSKHTGYPTSTALNTNDTQRTDPPSLRDLAVAYGRIYMVSYKGEVYCLDAISGTLYGVAK